MTAQPTRPLHRRPAVWVAAAVAVAVVLAAASVAVIRGRRGVGPTASQRVGALVATIPMGDSWSSAASWTYVQGDVGYVAWEENDKHLEVRSVELPGGRERWRVSLPSPGGQSWTGLIGFSGGVVAVPAEFPDRPGPAVALLGGAEKDRWTVPMRYSEALWFFAKTVVHTDEVNDRLDFLDARTGTVISSAPHPRSPVGHPFLLSVRTPADYTVPSATGDAPGRNTKGYPGVPGDHDPVVQFFPDGSARLFDAGTGALLARGSDVGEANDFFLAYDGRLYVAGTRSGYELVSYDLATLSGRRPLYRPEPAALLLDVAPCGRDRLCVLDQEGADDSTRLHAVKTDGGGEIWSRPAPGGRLLTGFGDRVLVRDDSGERSLLFDQDGQRIVDTPGRVVRVDLDTALVFSGRLTTSPANHHVTTLDVRTGRTVADLGTLGGIAAGDCSWNSTVILCPTAGDFRIWRIAVGSAG
ncbi:hypothetical protein [Rhizomonospora bruguierae]|uniref:hypothetical protein n=1 Tax=Rhizomonospora bruguierae TaxID=1581705 RepID=UPI001BCAEA0C|nr:hypothetical protein [Micromonospora sp. NBRC 107566]